MGRYLEFGTVASHFNFALRADFSERREYFRDFVLGGTRDKRIYGLTRITPSVTASYDLDGLKFLEYVLGTLNGTTIEVASNLPVSGSIAVDVDGEGYQIKNAQVDTWELTVETLEGATISYSRFVLRLNNQIDVIHRSDTLPSSLRPTGLEVSGRIRVPNYATGFGSEGSMQITIANIGTIYIPTVKFTEIPPRVTGFDLPETEVSFEGFPSGNNPAIRVVLADTVDMNW